MAGRQAGGQASGWRVGRRLGWLASRPVSPALSPPHSLQCAPCAHLLAHPHPTAPTQFYMILKLQQQVWPGLPNVHIWDYAR